MTTRIGQVIIAGLLSTISLSAVAHPGHGKSFGTAEEPNIMLWVWLALIGVGALAGLWRLFVTLFGGKKKSQPEESK